MTTASAYQFRAYIGPRDVPATNQYAFDWEDLHTTFDYDSWSRNLTTEMRTGTGELRINNTVGFPAQGGVYVWPQEGDPDYDTNHVEFMQYGGITSNQLTPLLRQSSRRSPHSAGDHVSPLYKLDGVTGDTLTLEYSVDDELLLHEWVCRFNGWLCPEGAMKAGHYVLVQERHLNNSGNWTGWSCWCLGILDTLKKQDDHEHAARWDGTIRPIPSVYMDSQLDAVRIGTWTIDEHCSATSSTTLPSVAAYKERAAEGYAAAAPSFSADNLLDDNDLLWISNRYFARDGSPHSNPSTNPLASNNEWPHVHPVSGFNNQQYSSMLVSQVNVNPPAGLPRGYRWIELTTYVTGIGNLRLVNKLDYGTDGLYQMILPQSLSGMAIGSHIVICENRGLFESMYPDHGAAIVISAEECIGNIFDHLDAAQDGIALLVHSSGQHLSIMGWGGQDMGPTAWRYSAWANPRTWVDETITAPQPGETMRYIYNPSNPSKSVHYWSTGPVETPGFDLPGYDRDNTLDTGSEDVPARWIKVDLPALDLVLAEDLAPGATTIAVEDANESPSVSGLKAAGVIQIGEEQIVYTGKNYDEGRLTGLSVTQPHSEGDIVYQVQQGTITDGYPIQTVTLTPANSGLRPENLEWGFSQLYLGARTPGEPGYENDYFVIAPRTWAITNGSYTIINPNNQRIRSFLLQIFSLNNEPNRPRLKRISFEVNREQFDADYWLEEDEAGVILYDILQTIGMPNTSITYEDGLPVIDGQITSVTAARSVITDFLRNKVCTMRIGFDSRVAISRNEYWFSTFHSELYTFDESSATGIQLDGSAPDDVRQVVLEYGPDEENLSTYKYPATANAFGSLLEIGPYDIAAGEASTYAQNAYKLSNWRRTGTVDLAAANTDVQTGDGCRVTWSFARVSPDYSKRHVVTGVVQTMREGHLFTRVVTRQIDSEEID